MCSSLSKSSRVCSSASASITPIVSMASRPRQHWTEHRRQVAHPRRPDVTLRRNVGEADRAEHRKQPAAVRGLDTARPQHAPHRIVHRRPGCVCRDDGLHRLDVVVLDDEPSTGPQRTGELGGDDITLGQVLQHEPGVDEVVARLLQRVDDHVVVAHLEVRRAQRFEPRRLDVGGDDVAGGTDLLERATRRPIRCLPRSRGNAIRRDPRAPSACGT